MKTSEKDVNRETFKGWQDLKKMKNALADYDSTVTITEVKNENVHWAGFKNLCKDVTASKTKLLKDINGAEDISATLTHKSLSDKTLVKKAEEFAEKIGDVQEFMDGLRKELSVIESLDQSADGLDIEGAVYKQLLSLKNKADNWSDGLRALVKSKKALLA